MVSCNYIYILIFKIRQHARDPKMFSFDMNLAILLGLHQISN